MTRKAGRQAGRQAGSDGLVDHALVNGQVLDDFTTDVCLTAYQTYKSNHIKWI